MTVLEGLLQSVVDEPACEANWLVLADWLEEHDDPRRAELLRLHRKLLATRCDPDQHPDRRQWQTRIVELLTQGVRPCVPQRTVVLGKGVEMTFSFVPPGSFLMGSPNTEAGHWVGETQRRVTLGRGYWIGVCPVTQDQWQAVMGNNPSRFQALKRPVERVSGDDCQSFCTRLSQMLGLDVRLPSGVEWEYACRAGTTTPFFFGETLSTDQANFHGGRPYGGGPKGVFRNQTTPVDQFPPNAWGLHDLHGNVWEWCQASAAPAPQTLRGGCWRAAPIACRSASHALRERLRAVFGSGLCGCRVCFSLG
jgi:uncharacterized protein (TIGR02996 family)